MVTSSFKHIEPMDSFVSTPDLVSPSTHLRYNAGSPPCGRRKKEHLKGPCTQRRFKPNTWFPRHGAKEGYCCPGMTLVKPRKRPKAKSTRGRKRRRRKQPPGGLGLERLVRSPSSPWLRRSHSSRSSCGQWDHLRCVGQFLALIRPVP